MFQSSVSSRVNDDKEVAAADEESEQTEKEDKVEDFFSIRKFNSSGQSRSSDKRVY